jgi:uncharacterized membrane protein YeiH
MVTALGGGTLRDVLLDRHPIVWIADVSYLWTSIAATVLTLLYVRRHVPPMRALLVADAFGLAFFSIGGLQIAEQVGQSGLVAVLMGTMTGVAGGIVRDVLSAEVPMLLRPGGLYASAAIGGTTSYLGLAALGCPHAVAAISGMAIVVGLRLVSVFWKIDLPALQLPADS